MTPDALAQAIEEFLRASPNAAVVEDGALAFDFATGARFSLTTEHNKCVLHLWSAERNAVRRVVHAELKNGNLRLSVLRFGQSKPSRLELCRDRDRRSSSSRKAARAAYRQRLHSLLLRQFPGWTIDRLTTEMDLERSFGPVYTRGLVRQGRSAFAILGVNAQETQASVDGALTFGILWLDLCRQRYANRCHIEGMTLVVPPGTSATVRQRMAHLDSAAARWQLWEFDEHDGSVLPLDSADSGNIDTRLLSQPDLAAARARFAHSIRHIQGLVPSAEMAVLSGAELSFRLHGLEFARAQLAASAASFRNTEQIVFGVGARETLLTPETAPLLAELTRELREARQAQGPHTHPLWRMAPERWLESVAVRNVALLDERLDPAFVYSQVPAFAAADRGMIDVLTVTRDARLAVLELKADEDIHLPLQGLDYWARVQWHHLREDFQRFGYFNASTRSGGPALREAQGGTGWRTLSPEPPVLILVAPALHIHPATDTLLRYISPTLDCSLVAIDERWRERLRVVFRKRRARPAAMD